MLKLCLKDAIAARWLWLLLLASYLLYGIQFSAWSGMAVILLGAGLMPGCLIVTLVMEHMCETAPLYASLPVRRATLVKGRYLLAGILAAVGGLIVFGSIPLIGFLTQALHGRAGIPPVLSLESVVGFFFFTAILVAGYLPFYYRFPFGRANVLFSMAMFLLGLLFTAAERLAANVFRVASPLITGEFLKDPGRAIFGAIGRVKEALGAPLFVAAACFLTAVTLAISIRLSVRFYKQREF